MKNSTQKQLAVSGGAQAVSISAPSWPVCGEYERSTMDAVLVSGNWSFNGPHEQAFCEEYRRFIGTEHCVCLANGTVTIQCALQAAGVKPGDEVIVPGMTWVATAQAAMDIGANVVFADIDPVTLCLDPKSFEKAITKKTKAVIPVHLYGCMCDMDAIMDIATKHKLKVIEDVAHQHGSRWRNKGAGAIGDAGSFSFQQSKVLSSGEGGAVTCNNPEIYEIVHCLKHVGWRPDSMGGGRGMRYGHNYRMTEMQAVLLRGGLRRLPEHTRIREENAERIREGLEKIGGPLRVAPRDPRVTRQAYYALTLTYDQQAAGGMYRDVFNWAVNSEGGPFGGIYEPVYAAKLLNLYDDRTSPIPYRDPKTVQDYSKLKLPNVEKAFNETAVILPHWALLGDEKYTDQLIEAVNKVTANLKEVKKSYSLLEKIKQK